MIRFGKITSGTQYKQSGTRWEIEENGIARLFETYVCNASELFQRMPARGSPHPLYPNLTVKRLSPAQQPLGLLEYTVEYSGLGGSAEVGTGGTELPEPVYRLSRSQRSDPITTHPNWANIVAAAGAANVKYDDNGLFLGIGKDSDDASLVGVSDYLNFGAVFSKSYVAFARPSLSGVGTIDSPPDAPAVASGFNWLKIAADYEEEGGVYSVFEAWMLSGRGGWNSTIYS